MHSGEKVSLSELGRNSMKEKFRRDFSPEVFKGLNGQVAVKGKIKRKLPL